MAITGGFGVTIDTRTGVSRCWFIGRDGFKRWADTGAPTEPACDRSACGDHRPGPCDNPDCEALIQPSEAGDCMKGERE